MKYTRLGRRARAIRIITILQAATRDMVEPAASQIVKLYGQNPYLILISCILSLRTKDTTSLPASIRLFDEAKTPQELLKIPISKIEKIIYPVGFYRRKSKTLHEVSAQIIANHGGRVPNTLEGLMELPGVGRKTANLTLGLGFGIPAICVDTHVHRISNRLGLVATKTVEETEQELKKVLPQKYWAEYNHLLVKWGQNICVPISPFCSQCAIADYCPRVGVKKSR